MQRKAVLERGLTDVSQFMGNLRCWIVVLATAACAAGMAEAATFLVTKTADTDDGTCDADCSVREAVLAANAAASADQIDLPTGTYTLSLAGAGEDLASTGDLDVRDHLTIIGAGAQATIIDGDGSDRIFETHCLPSSPLPTVSVTITDLTMQNGNSADGRGVGGAVGSFCDTNLNLARVTVRNNTSTFSIPAITSEGYDTLTIADSTVSGNFEGGLKVAGVVDIANTTVSGNHTTFSRGGGLSISGSSPPYVTSVTLNNVTIAGNSNAGVGMAAGLEITNLNSSVSVANSILADNDDVNCGVGGTFVSDGHNLSDDASCPFNSAGDLPPVDADLKPLAENGGATETHALAPLSQAVNAGSAAAPGSAGGACEALDQRGVVRPQAGRCDMGALERVPTETCGDGLVEGAEECDDYNAADGDGCSSNCEEQAAPESTADPSVAAGETVSTDAEADGATAADPVESSVFLPVGQGSVSITETITATPPAAGFAFLNQQVDIEFDCPTEPCPSAAQPLRMVFVVDVSRVPAGQDENSLQVFKDGELVGDCATSESAVADPDPCLKRQRLADGDIEFTVLTSDASQWNFAVPDGVVARRVGAKKLLIKDHPEATKRRLVFFSKSADVAPGIFGGPNDPTCAGSAGGGGRLQVFGTGASGQSVDIALPCGGWSVLGNVAAPRGYKYSDPSRLTGPCTLVVVERGKLVRAVCSAKNPSYPLAYNLDAAGEGSVAVVLTTGERLAHCAAFGGTIVRDEEGIFKAIDSSAPTMCPSH